MNIVGIRNIDFTGLVKNDVKKSNNIPSNNVFDTFEKNNSRNVSFGSGQSLGNKLFDVEFLKIHPDFIVGKALEHIPYRQGNPMSVAATSFDIRFNSNFVQLKNKDCCMYLKYDFKGNDRITLKRNRNLVFSDAILNTYSYDCSDSVLKLFNARIPREKDAIESRSLFNSKTLIRMVKKSNPNNNGQTYFVPEIAHFKYMPLAGDSNSARANIAVSSKDKINYYIYEGVNVSEPVAKYNSKTNKLDILKEFPLQHSIDYPKLCKDYKKAYNAEEIKVSKMYALLHDVLEKADMKNYLGFSIDR